jgi:hypothetical protein
LVPCSVTHANTSKSDSEVKKLLELLHRVIWVIDRMANNSRIRKDLIVVSTFVSLVTKEVDDFVINTVGLLGLGFDVLEAVGLVPACGEDVKGDLATDGVSGIIDL